MMEKIDRELVASARSGDREAFGELIERHQPACLRLAMSLVNDRETAREIVQEAVLQAYLSLDDLREDAKFANWLLGIVANGCRSYWRDRTSPSPPDVAGGGTFDAIGLWNAAESPTERAEQRELHDLLSAALDALPSKSRSAVHLFYFERRSVREIAEILHLSITAVKGRLHRARQHLRERLLPVSAELLPELVAQGKGRAMIPLTVADVVLQGERSGCVVVLHDEERHRLLPIWIGTAEGEAIALGLRGYRFPRPMTHTFMAKLLEATGATLEHVRIESLKGTTYYAIVRLTSGAELDARPSDALALAVRMGSPIFATEEVMNKGAVEIPEQLRETAPLGRGIDAIVREVEGKAVRTTEAQLRHLVAFVFGTEITFAQEGHGE